MKALIGRGEFISYRLESNHLSEISLYIN